MPGSPTYGDLLIVNSDLCLTSDANPAGTMAILQDVVQRLRTFLGEWFMDTSAGVPWLQQILVKGVSLAVVDELIQNAILATPGVLQLANYSSTANSVGRFLSVSFSLITSSGTVSYTLDGSSLL